jgi:uncharacterized protein YlxW (UPF0749 family)
MPDPHSHGAPQEAPPPWHARIARAFHLRYSRYAEHGLAWRLLTPAIFIAAGVLFVTSAISSGGTDLRPGRYADLADLAVSRSDRVAELGDQRSELQSEVDRLTKDLSGTDLDEANAELDALRGPAGLEPVRGPGVTITLDDAPEPPLGDEEEDVTFKLVHQQDIQAVANALWAGGAEAVTVQGHRIVSTTGIKCVGNSVLLQGVAYPPPYVISGIGDVSSMLGRIDADPAIQSYLADVETYGIQWDLDVNPELEFPAYDGSVETEYARPMSTEDDGT